MRREPDPPSREQGAVDVRRATVGGRLVRRLPLLEERAKAVTIDGERPAATRDAPPCLLRSRLEQEHERCLEEQRSRGLRAESAAAQLDDGRRGGSEDFGGGVLLELAERGLPARREDLGNGQAGAVLDHRVDGDERPTEPGCELRPQRRFPRAHEAHEHEVAVQSVRRQSSRGQRMRSR
jgi:hypothetical protein